MNAWSLASGLVGALLVFCLGFARELWRDERERRGILRLLRAEFQHNHEVASRVRRHRGQLIGPDHLILMHADAWRDTKVKAAYLLPSKLLDDIEEYYFSLETLLTMLDLDEDELRGAPGAGGTPRGQNPWTWYASKVTKLPYEIQKEIDAYLKHWWITNIFAAVFRRTK
jgi:hypothetical protein